MSDSKHRDPDGSAPADAGQSPGPGPGQAESGLDIEPDALLDSLLADPDSERAPGGEPRELGDIDEDEVTGVAHQPPALSPAVTPASLPAEFSEVDELLTSSVPPPAKTPKAARPPPPSAARPPSAKTTLQGIRPAGIPRPRLGAPAVIGPKAPSPTGTQKPPAVNPAGPARREPFPPATSPRPPGARVAPLAGDDEEEPTLRAILTDTDDPGRASEYSLADELEPQDDTGTADSAVASLASDFEDLDEDILESVPPEPVEAIDTVAPEAPSSLPPDSASGPLPSPPASRSLPSEPGARLAADTFVDDERTELFDSLHDEALGTYGSERPASEHLAERGVLDEWQERAQWFEREARSMSDPGAKARALLIASEIFALVGDLGRARSVASEIHATQPAMALGSRQLRWLAAAQQDYKAALGTLELETRASPTPQARAHAATLAADVHRVSFGDTDNARRKLDLAARVLPSDPRPYLLRLAEQLGQSANPPRLRAPEVEELSSLARVAEELERLRGPVKHAGEPSSTQAITLEETRRSLATRDLVPAIEALARLGRAPGMRRAALWLGAALAAPAETTRPRALEMLRELIAKEGSVLARRALAARALEQGDADGARAALDEGDQASNAFDSATRVVLDVLAAAQSSESSADLEDLAIGPLRPLAAAVAAARCGLEEELAISTGDERQQDEIRTGRALAAALGAGAAASRRSIPPADTTAPPVPQPLSRLSDISELFVARHGQIPITQVLSIEFALVRGDSSTVARMLSEWPGMETGPAKALVSALVLELAGERAQAREYYQRAIELDPNHEGAARALLADASPAAGAELLAKLADNCDDRTQAGFLLLEAALRRTDDPRASEEHLVQAATSAPDLPLVYLHGEHQARQRGDAELLLSWLRQRRENATDKVDRAFDFVREALLVAESDMELAAGLLGDALAARPEDVALHELHERLASHPGVERGKWREKVAAKVNPDARQRLLVEAALEYERAGDLANASRVARQAAEDGSEFMRLTAEKLELAQGNTAAQSESLLKAARSEQDVDTQRELYERLSELDESKGDRSSSLLWQTAILERSPDHLPALRRLEHEYVSKGRWDELEPIALALCKQLDPAEADARAIWVTQHRVLSGKWEAAREAIDIACRLEHPSLWALRAFASQTRGSDELEALLRVELELIARCHTPLDFATLSLRAAEAATRLGKLDAARELLQQAIRKVPHHLVALTTLADVLEAKGAPLEAAEALEAAASAYRTPKHQVEFWHQAAVLWQDSVGDEQRAVHALEAALERDISHGEAFRRLQDIYVKARETRKLAELLDRRLAATHDPEERIGIEVMRGRALAGVGEKQAAKQALAAALDANPEHAEALDAFAELCRDEGDWAGAEQAWIRLARHVGDAERQAAIYTKLGALYDDQLPNPERAEMAYQEVLKRQPQNLAAMERLVETYVNLRNEEKAVALQQQLIDQAPDEASKRDRTLQLAKVHERMSQDPRKALAVLESAKKTYGNDSRVLQAQAEYLQRRGEDRAMTLLLDRAANEARRALGTGRFDVAFFETLSTVSELRGAMDGALVARATLAALRGEPVEISGAGPRAADARVDELLAPAALSAPLRILLRKAGHILDAAYPVDLRALRATPLGASAHQLQEHVEQVSQAFGLAGVEVFSSPALGPICMPVSSDPPRLVYGDSLLASDQEVARYFLLIRALKILQTRAATIARTAPVDLWPMLAGFLSAFAANWEPQGADPRKTAQATGRVRAAILGQLDGDVPVLALEVIGSIGNRASQLGMAAHQYGSRTALLAVGDANAALQGIALAAGQEKGLPHSPSERLKWVVRSPEARDLLVFSVSEHYFQARETLGIQAT